MTDAQILSLVITVLAILAGTITTNMRIRDLNEVLRAGCEAQRAESAAHFDRLEGKIDRIAETVSAMLSDHEHRLRAIEQRPR